MLRALLFDFDGLILDTETPEVEGWTEVFASYGTTFPMDYWANALGRGADQLYETPMAVLERLSGQTLDHDVVKVEYDAIRMAKILERAPLPGVVALLEAAMAEQLPCAVVSSSKHPWVDGHLSRLGLAHYFRMTVCAGDAPRAKPYPDLYEEALRQFGIGPKEAIAFEDSPNGSRAAVDAGLFTLAVPNAVSKTLDLSHASLQADSLEGFTLNDLRALVS